MATYEDVHAGDLVLGHDNAVWGVAEIVRTPRLAVTLVKDDGHTRVTGYPPGGTEVAIVQRADISQEMSAAQLLIEAGVGVELIAETWIT